MRQATSAALSIVGPPSAPGKVMLAWMPMITTSEASVPSVRRIMRRKSVLLVGLMCWKFITIIARRLKTRRWPHRL